MARFRASLVAVVAAAVLLVPAALPSSWTASSAAFALEPGITTTAADHRFIGFYQPNACWDMGPLSFLEAELSLKAAFIDVFRNQDQSFPINDVLIAEARGSQPMITLELWDVPQSSGQSYLQAIASGAVDPYLHQWAREAAAHKGVVWVRMFHEMNGSWYPWSNPNSIYPQSARNTSAQFGPAWRHVHDIFQAEGATNVKWVWCANAESCNKNGVNTADNTYRLWYPGDAYVDYIAIDAYNFGETWNGLHWRSFASLFDHAYAEACALSSSKPMFIAETGCSDNGGNKGAWITDMFNTLPARYPRFAGFGWFDSTDTHLKADLRLETSTPGLLAFRAGASRGCWNTGQPLFTPSAPLPYELKRATAVTLKTSTSRARRSRYFTLSGVLRPGQRADRLRIDMRRPGSSRWVYVSMPKTGNAAATWAYRYKIARKGRYQFRVRYLGDGTRKPSTSGVVKVTVR